jgi:hypothetical protein
MLNKKVRKVGGNIEKSPIYYFSNETEISIFADIEGAFPFTNIPEQHKLKIPFILEDEDNLGNIIKIKSQNNKGFVFTGDLIDKSKYDIRWLSAMCNAKSKSKNNVLLGIGNRDINKIRMLDECFITVDNILPWEVEIDEKLNFEDLCKIIATYKENKGNSENNTNVYRFSFETEDIEKKYKDNNGNKYEKPNVDNYPKLFAKSDQGYDTIPCDMEYTDKIERIKLIYEKTLGAKEVLENRWQELKELRYVNDEKVEDNVKYVSLAITNMMMTLIWPENYINSKCKNENIKNLFKYINGLHIKYLQNAHIIGKFTKNLKNYIFSHSGIPNVLSAPLGYLQYNDDNNIHSHNKNKYYGETYKLLHNILINIEKEKNDFINIFDIQNYKSKITAKEIIEYIKKNILKHDKLYKYIQLSAPTGYRKYNNIKFGSINSPIVLQYTGYLRKGGGEEKKDILYYKRDNNIHYNIFGHQPQGYFPTAIYNIDGSYDICLDVTNIKHEKNQEVGMSYAFMYIDKKDKITINGRIVNSNDVINEIFNGNKYLIYTKSLEDFKITRKKYDKNNKDNEKNNLRIVNINDSLRLKYKQNPKYSETIEYIASHGGGKKKTLKPTSNKIKVGKLYRKVYIGPRGGKYIKYKGEYISIKSLNKCI